MLVIKNLETGYNKKQVLFDLSIEVRTGEIVAIIGPNGAGKSSLLKAITGLIHVWSGQIIFEGRTINGFSPAQNATNGITLSLQGIRVFTDLTVMENLEIGGFQLPKKELLPRIDEVLEMFPVFKKRIRQNAMNLSGGEQQMLAIARALIPKPRLLILDEPSLGLSPSFVDTVFSKVCKIREETGASILIVEQNVKAVLDISDRVYSIKLGKVYFNGLPAELNGNKEKLRQLFL